jgi:hypothetical protein
VGKAQTALEFVYRNKGKFDIIFWTAADTLVKLNQAYGSFASALGLESALQGGARVREDVKERLCNTGA